MNVVQVTYQHPDATMPLLVPVLVVPNTPEDVVDGHIRANAARGLPWLMAEEPHDGVAILCGGGPSIAGEIDTIRAMVRDGGALFGLNGAATWLADRNLEVDIQVILDGKKETAALVEPRARRKLFSSQVHPDTVDMVIRPTLFHLNNTGIESLFPPERVRAGGYALIGGGVSVGITAMVLAYALGYRTLHVFGYDSCNQAGETHAYPQAMNQFIPNINVEWGRETYNASMPMKLQAEAFPKFAKELQDAGCAITVHGHGLLPAMWREPPATERQKYRRMWSDPRYRTVSPGEWLVETFLDVAKPDGAVIDFGCGTGRAAKAIAERGLDVILIDFADNCRDRDVMHLPFVECDLTRPIPVSAPHGFCTDVLEHIPPEDVRTVIANIMDAAPTVFFQISTVADQFGATIGMPLHLTVEPHGWWLEMFGSMGLSVSWHVDRGDASCFLVSHTD